MLKIVSENFIHALLLFLGLFLKISRWVPLSNYAHCVLCIISMIMIMIIIMIIIIIIIIIIMYCVYFSALFAAWVAIEGFHKGTLTV